jgi:hypothetical protein
MKRYFHLRSFAGVSVYLMLLAVGFSYVNAGSAANDPSGEELISLLGRRADSSEVRSFVKQYRLHLAGKNDSYCREDEAISFELGLRRRPAEIPAVERVYIFLKPWLGNERSFTGVLPYGILTSDSADDIKQRLGVGSAEWRRNSDGREDLNLNYELHGHQITLVYEGGGNSLSRIVIQPPRRQPLLDWNNQALVTIVILSLVPLFLLYRLLRRRLRL